jgi:hypothetical protein
MPTHLTGTSANTYRSERTWPALILLLSPTASKPWMVGRFRDGTAIVRYLWEPIP